MIEAASATSFQVGDVQCDLLDEGQFRLDGGAMYRVVPKALWERGAPADERNRITLAMRPLLIRSGKETILVETGIGPERRDPKFTDMCAIERGPGVEAGLSELGLTTADVTRVVLTHMHFDHGGGLLADDGGLRFPNAVVSVQKDELEDSTEGCPLCRASYLAPDYDPIREAQRFEVLEGDTEIVPGISVEVTGGHTRAHQILKIQAGDETVAFWGDLIPTSLHVRPHYVMAYDLYPRQSWEAKTRLVPQMVEEGWINVFYHDPKTPLGKVVPDGRSFRVESLGATD
jgi:glyoxylase-like metal-dependent hydrolase (beta-lactamase superfamily II)